MSPQRQTFSEDTIERWVRMRAEGWSFKRIGEIEDVDRRVVTARVREYESRRSLESLQEARRDVAAKFLEQHFDDLEIAAHEILRLSLPPTRRPSLCPSYDEFHPRFPELQPSLIRILKGIYLAKRYWLHGSVERRAPLVGPQAYGAGPDDTAGQREAQEVLEVLEEHVPGVATLLRRWEEAGQRYWQTWFKLEGLGGGEGLPGEAVREALEDLVRSALRTNELKGDPSKEEARASSDRLAYTAARDRLYQSGQAREGIEELVGYLRSLEATYGELNKLLDRTKLRRVLLTTECRSCPIAPSTIRRRRDGTR